MPSKKLVCPFPKLSPSLLHQNDEYFMSLAYNQAIKAWEADEVPIGAVIVYKNQLIASAFNQVETLKDPTAHAEILAITQASKAIGDWRLNEAKLYVTKEPCPMCAGASIMSRLAQVIFAVPDSKMGCLGGSFPLHTLPGLNHKLNIKTNILTAPCQQLLQAFFSRKRSKNSDIIEPLNP